MIVRELPDMASEPTIAAYTIALVYYPRVTPIFYLGCAALMAMVWDWVDNFDTERRLLWNEKRTWGSLLYFALRFFSIAAGVFDIIVMNLRWTDMDFCKGFYYKVAACLFIQCAIAQLMFQGRVYALYNREQKLLYINGALFVGVQVAVIALLAHYLPKIQPFATPHPVPGCWALVPRHTAFCLVPVTAYQLYICTLVALKSLQHVRLISHWPNGGFVMMLLFKHHAICFGTSTMMLFGNIFVFLYAPDGYNFAGIPIFNAIVCNGGCRLVLALRKAYIVLRPSNDEYADGAQPATGPIHIANPFSKQEPGDSMFEMTNLRDAWGAADVESSIGGEDTTTTAAKISTMHTSDLDYENGSIAVGGYKETPRTSDEYLGEP